MSRYLNQIQFALVFGPIIYFGFFASKWNDEEIDTASNV